MEKILSELSGFLSVFMVRGRESEGPILEKRTSTLWVGVECDRGDFRLLGIYISYIL